MHDLDWLTVIMYLLLVAAGAVSIYAASYDFDHANMFSFDEFSGKQIRWIGLSLCLGVVLLLIDKRIYETYAFPAYLAVVILLIVTIFVAPDTKGSRSWLVFGPMSLQPAEFGKFATALALARLFSSYNFSLNATLSNYAKAIAIIMVPCALIVCQRETGSALVYLSLFFVLYREGMSGLVLSAALMAVTIFVVSVKFVDTTVMDIPSGQFYLLMMLMILTSAMTMLYCRNLRVARNITLWYTGTALVSATLHLCGAGMSGYLYYGISLGVSMLYLAFEYLRLRIGRLLIVIGTVIGAVLFMCSVSYVFNSVLKPYQQMRIKVALGIEEDLRGVGYNVNQSKIAIGSGGLTGKGFLQGTQTKLKYVPEQHTDFIFCTIGEEEGFVGTLAVVALFLMLILRVVHIAERQPDTFGRVYGYCVASYLIFHFCINIGMVIGLCPVIGIPLPFFSYGGSSLWGFTILLFILLKLDSERHNRPNY